MEQTLNVQLRKLNGKVAIIILSIAAIVLRIFAYFQTVGSNFFNMMIPFLPHSMLEMEFSFEYFVRLFTSVHFPEYLLSFLTSLIVPTLFVIRDILPILLFVVYLAFFFKKSKATVLLPITFGVFALGWFITLIYVTISLIRGIIIVLELNITGTIDMVITFMFMIFSYAIIIVAVVLLLIGSLKGFVNKPLVVIPCTSVIAPNVIIGIIAGFLMTISGIIVTIDSIMTNNFNMASTSFTVWLSGISSVTVSLCIISFFIAILVFVAKNYVPEIIPMSDAKLAVLAAKKPKQALEILKMRYETGKLTEEEYNARVAEISLIE